MAVEPRRGCGYRRIGGTYLEGEKGPGYECGRLPLPVKPCPLCEQRPAFTRGMQYITPRHLLHVQKVCKAAEDHCYRCPLSDAVSMDTAGLMWVGRRFYTPEEFTKEAVALGPSKRVGWPLPRWFQLGTTWVFLAHEQAAQEQCPECAGQGEPPRGARITGGLELGVQQCLECRGTGTVPTAGVFHVFRPTRVVRIIPDTMPEEDRALLREQGLTLVEVPANDPDHQPARRDAED